MESYFSCQYIEHGMNFYPNDIIKVCCFTRDPAVDACRTSEPINVIVEKLFHKKAEMAHEFLNGNIYDCCKKCSCLGRRQWGFYPKQISSISLNHFMFCNLKCGHCGYAKEMQQNELLDTDHGRVLEIIKGLKAYKILAPDVTFDVGGGEPSVADGLLGIVQYCVENNHRVHINSNGARYVETIVNGVNNGLIYLTLTPDAGSREVYRAIKGHDNFIQTWKNIEKYHHACPNNVEVKFILQEGNLSDISNMVEMCVSAGVKVVNLSMDLRIEQERHVDYAPHVDMFRSLAKSRSLVVKKSPLLPDHLWH